MNHLGARSDWILKGISSPYCLLLVSPLAQNEPGSLIRTLIIQTTVRTLIQTAADVPFLPAGRRTASDTRVRRDHDRRYPTSRKHVKLKLKVQVPVLMVSAGLDRVVSSRAVEILGKRLRIGGHISVDGARHEILQERDQIRDQFFAAFDTLIPGTPSGV